LTLPPVNIPPRISDVVRIVQGTLQGSEGIVVDDTALLGPRLCLVRTDSHDFWIPDVWLEVITDPMSAPLTVEEKGNDRGNRTENTDHEQHVGEGDLTGRLDGIA
jgi:hypothetical protein